MKKSIALFLCLLFLSVPAMAEAPETPENGYIARISSSVQLYAAEETDAPAFITIEDRETAEEYLKLGLIEYYEKNDLVYLHGEVRWQQTTMNLPAAWEKNVTGSGITVGVLDSGVYPHTDLQDNLVEGINVLDTTEDTVDTFGHGTRVAGLIAAASEDAAHMGMAPGASIMPIKCFEGQSTRVPAIVTGIIYGADNGCDILNMSFGLATNYQSVYDAISYAAGKGVLLVASSGNGGTNAISYPAAYENVIGVGAVTEELERASYSQYNAYVDIAAPGNCMGTTDMDGGYMTAEDTYNELNGTSFAAPMITGILALGLAYKPDKDPKLVADALLEGAKDLGIAGPDTFYGYGLADAEAFLNELDKEEVPRMQYLGTVISAYNPSEKPLRLYGAIYDESFSKLEQFTTVPIQKGYNRFYIPLSETTKLFLMDGLRPVCDVIQG